MKLEPKRVSGFKRVVVYGPGATLADPPTRAEKTFLRGIKKGKEGTKSFSFRIKSKISSAWNWIKVKGMKIKERAKGFLRKAGRSLASTFSRFSRNKTGRFGLIGSGEHVRIRKTYGSLGESKGKPDSRKT